MKISGFKTDPVRETEGVWFDLRDGLRVLVARMRNERHKQRIRELMRPHLQGARRGQLAIEIVEKMNLQAMSETVILGWENLEEDDGSPILYSSGKALELMKEYPEFAEIVSEFAGDIENYREEIRADAEEN